ncbi:DUF7169 domain-containing protein [Streptomyces asiaticus]|uniref:DUF7169 domain-containing protein n=1 Tax=Streptomyces asiaticus TaxID=114695 RepID=UPI0033856CDC
MTYSPNHATDGHQLSHLVTRLKDAVDELEQMVIACGDTLYLPSRRPHADPDGTGRQATREPSRPTEDTALDGARLRMHREHDIGTTYITHALAYVMGVTAALDRALSRWEGQAPLTNSYGGDIDHPDWAAEDAERERRPG